MKTSENPSFIEELIRRNISFYFDASVMIALISIIGLVGTYAPTHAGLVLPFLNATVVYLLLGGTNLFFMFLFFLARRAVADKRLNRKHFQILGVLFGMINMILACLTFFTTQKGSSFFFEYILVTVIVCLVPLYDLKGILHNVGVNMIATIGLIHVLHHRVAWQDWVDLVAFALVCVAISQFRWNINIRYETIRIQMQQNETNISNKARKDALTGLLNRTALRDDFPQYVNRQCCIAMLDIDSFKKMNDIYGHIHGDQVLSYVGGQMRRIFHKPEDFCYRYGGDEFLIIATGESREAFVNSLDTLRDHCNTIVNPYRASLSIGYILDTPHTEDDLRVCIREADRYLYQAKSAGDEKVIGSDAQGIYGPMREEEGTAQETTLDDLMQRFSSAVGKTRTLVYFNILHFTELNERVGHYEGIRIIRETKRVIRNGFGKNSLAVLSPDRFLVLSDLDAEKAASLAADAQWQVSELLPTNHIILCVGICSCRADEVQKEFLTEMNYARYACAQAEVNIGISRYLCVFDDKMRRDLDMEKFLRAHLEEALAQGQIVPYYQPLIGSLSENTVGFETLARWEDPEKGRISPADFVPLLERMNLTFKLDLYMLRRVCEDIRNHPILTSGVAFVTVNLSRSDFLCCDMPAEIRKVLDEYSFPKDMIQFEVTESALEDNGAVRESVRIMKKAGYLIWIDDFGTGQSSLYELVKSDVCGIKLDQAFFRNFAEDDKEQIVIRSIAELCHQTGLLMIAEGIENAGTFWYARNWGVNFIQGYYFSEPLSLDQVLSSPFCSRISDRKDTLFYRPAANIILYRPIEQQYYSPEKQMIFGKAVLERKRDSIRFVRMSHAIFSLFKQEFQKDDLYNQIDTDSVLLAELLRQMGLADAVEDVIDFPLQIHQKKFHGQIRHLTSGQDMAMYVFSVSNYGIENPLPAV